MSVSVVTRFVILGTLLVGLLVAVVLTLVTPPTERTLVAAVGPAQTLMSVLTPLVGIRLVGDLRRSRGHRLVPSVVTGLAVAAALGAVVFLVALGTVAATSSATGRFEHGARLALGSVLVQCVALLTGTGLGLLIRPPVLAFVATIVIPLGLWLLLGSTAALAPARGWLTQFESARKLLAGTMGGLDWLKFGVMVLIWGVGVNALGARRLGRTPGPRDD